MHPTDETQQCIHPQTPITPSGKNHGLLPDPQPPSASRTQRMKRIHLSIHPPGDSIRNDPGLDWQASQGAPEVEARRANRRPTAARVCGGPGPSDDHEMPERKELPQSFRCILSPVSTAATVHSPFAALVHRLYTDTLLLVRMTPKRSSYKNH